MIKVEVSEKKEDYICEKGNLIAWSWFWVLSPTIFWIMFLIISFAIILILRLISRMVIHIKRQKIINEIKNDTKT